MLIYLNGKFYPKEKARISVFDHGFLYGDGVFEGIRAYHGRVFRLQEHIHRLYASARALTLTIPCTPQELATAVIETVRRNHLKDSYIRVVVSRGEGDLGLDPRKCAKPNVIIIAASITLYDRALYTKGLSTVTVATRRNIPEALDPKIKSLNYLNNILAKIETNLAQVPEGIMLNREGYVAEATGDNIFIVSQGRLLTPAPHSGILMGVTRQVVIELAKKLSIPVKETLLTLYDLYTADECFLTGTAAEVIPVVQIDGRTIGSGSPGPITRQLMESFLKLTQTEGTPIAPPSSRARTKPRSRSRDRAAR